LLTRNDKRTPIDFAGPVRACELLDYGSILPYTFNRRKRDQTGNHTGDWLRFFCWG
jgi:hypothetical protein